MKMANGSISNIDSQYNPVFTKANVEAMLNGDPLLTDGIMVTILIKYSEQAINQKHNVTIREVVIRCVTFASVGYLESKR
ncbi:hypothetical protein NXX23_20930 [Bacteroides ovatus]|nr:hypothetical protein [Bacteroides ovatus]